MKSRTTMDQVLKAAHHYRMPLKDTYVFYMPDTLSIVDGNRDIAYIMDCCSIPVVFDTLVRRVETAYQNYSRETVTDQINDMIKSDLLIDLSTKSRKPHRTLPQIQNHDINYKRISIHVTDRCNLECQYCYNKADRLKYQRKELTFINWERILKDIFSYNIPSKITISGGEPLLYDELYELVCLIKNHKIRVEILSNGTQCDSKAIKIFDKVDQVVISLDSHIEKINNLSRGHGSYSKVMSTLDILDKRGIAFGINSVLTTYNISTIGETIRYMRNRYKSLMGVMPIFQEAWHLAPHLVPSKRQMDENYECNLGTTSINKELEDQLIVAWGNSLSYRAACTVASKEFAIATDGNVLPCRAMYFEAMNAGKLNGRNFREIWEDSPVLNMVRKANNKRSQVCREANCDFQSICLGGCLAHSYSATGKLLPFVDENDCYRFKQMSMLKMHIKLKHAKDEI
ncbi:MAG: radical SAM protein [Candidatus Aegiribacteria sp.]|nr:radical SAM protein [Candidatus Aegiribacteria sp.]